MGINKKTLAGILAGMGGGVSTPAPYFVLDVAGGIFKANGTTYSSEAEMNTALGITKSGETRLVPAYVDPAATELVTNGTFTGGDISGWTAGQLSGSGASIAAGSGANTDRLVLNTGGATQAWARQQKTLEQGKAYRLRADVGRDTTSGRDILGASYASNHQYPQGYLDLTPTVGALVNMEVVTGCVQTASTPAPRNIEPATYPGNVYFRLGSNGTTEASGIYFFDNVSIKECVILPGAVWNKLGCIFTFTTPSSFTKVETALQFGIDGNTPTANSEKSRIRLSIDASGVLTWSVLVKNISAISQVLGTLTPSTQYTVWLHNGPDTFGARLGSGGTLYWRPAASIGGGEILTKSSLDTIPSLGKMWVGRSAFTAAADTFTGVVNKLVLHSDTVFPAARPIISLGDSLAFLGASGHNTDPAFGNSAYYGLNEYWPSMLSRATARPSRSVIFSWGGAYGSSIRAAFGDGQTHTQMTPVISAGNGQFATITDSFAPYASLDPIFIINNTYNLMAGSSSLSNANLNATESINQAIAQIRDIRAVYSQFNKFLFVGGRWGPGLGPDAQLLPGGYKATGMIKLNTDAPAALTAAETTDGLSTGSYAFANIQTFLTNNSGDAALSGLAAAGLTANAQDLTDIGNDQIPSQLRIDAIHQSSYGQTAESEFYRLKLAALGWDTFSTDGTIYALSA